MKDKFPYIILWKSSTASGYSFYARFDLIYRNHPLFTTGSRKKGRRGVLRSLLCCFGSGDGSGNGGAGESSKGSGSEGRYSPPSPGSPRFLLPPVRHQDMHKKCMVIDLDETLVHSSFKVLKLKLITIIISLEVKCPVPLWLLLLFILLLT